MRPFRFMLTAWGDRHVGWFLDLLVPSIVANLVDVRLPRSEGRHAVLLATTARDWERVRKSDAAVDLRNYGCDLVPFLIAGEATPGMAADKYQWATLGYDLTAAAAYADGGWGCVLTPDCVISSGMLAALARRAEAGAKVVVAPGIMANEEMALPELRQATAAFGALSPRYLSGLFLDCPQRLVETWHWESESFSSMPSAVLFRSGAGVVAFCLSWAMLLLDYSAAPRSVGLGGQTIDGSHVFDHFGDPGEPEVQVIKDSGEAFTLSWAPQPPEESPHFAKWTRLVDPEEAERVKRRNVREYVLWPDRFDALKRRLFFDPVHIRADGIDAATLERASYLSRWMREQVFSAEAI